MSKTRVTQADVAARAGVSTTAVSLVMNDRPGTRISPDAVERVRIAAKELGYRPNLTARALSMQRSEIIGFISDLVTTGRFGNALISGALEEARLHNHVLFIAETGGESKNAARAVEALLDRQVDGIVFASTRPDQLTLPERSSTTPIVLLNTTDGGVSPTVLADERDGAYRIVTELLGGGASNVAIVGRRLDEAHDSRVNVGVQRRLIGIAEALGEHGTEPIAEISCDPWTLETGYDATHDLFATNPHVDALICLNDRIAFGAYRAVHELGLTIPDDVSVVSFDDDDIAVYLQPQLTTAAFPYREMGALAVRTLLGTGTPPHEQLISMPIRHRGSVRAQ